MSDLIEKLFQPVRSLPIALNVKDVEHLTPPAHCWILAAAPRPFNRFSGERLEYLSVRHSSRHEFRKRLIRIEERELSPLEKIANVESFASQAGGDAQP